MMRHEITLTLRGAAQLIGHHRGCYVQQVRGANFARPDHAVLVGRYHAQPPMNMPTVFTLRDVDRVLLVHGRAFDPANNLFAPLLYSPGRRVEVPTPIPIPPDNLLADLTRIFQAARWRFARTYVGTGLEHSYWRRADAPDDAVFLRATKMIQRHGHREFVNKGWWTSLDVPPLHVWCGRRYPPPPSALINSRPLERDPVPMVADQVLIAENAVLLPVPLLPTVDPRRTLAYLLFGGDGR